MKMFCWFTGRKEERGDVDGRRGRPAWIKRRRWEAREGRSWRMVDWMSAGVIVDAEGRGRRRSERELVKRMVRVGEIGEAGDDGEVEGKRGSIAPAFW
jgi:hypothetical protein